MKIKTSITMSEDVLKEIDRRSGSSKSRSDFVEMATRALLQRLKRQEDDARDVAIINRNAKRLNREAMDVLSYQIPL